ncbi:hypothetical protein MNBD_GAMMA20-2025 [hydrothermal vent metagenome]|uniref:Uncharacterized protein n=1 Tax=hydrothermal vent metagenome TaxID=652676 RepID=A0A3B1BAH7_9ZZZZ
MPAMDPLLIFNAKLQGLSRKAHLAGKGCSLRKRRNAVDESFQTRPEGALQMHPGGVASLGKEAEPRLA